MEINRNAHNAFAILAGALFLVGVCGLLLTVTAEPPGGPDLDCGSAATGTRSAIAYDASQASARQRTETTDNNTPIDTSQKVTAHVTACDTAINTRRSWAWPTTAAGALGLAVLLYLARFVPPPPQSRWPNRGPWESGNHR